MPRVPTSPPFPDSSSRWLANFRYRQRDAQGHRRSPESLGRQIGVSGATIRRWESGQTIPSEIDLRRFTEACGLSAMQTEFVHRLFSRRGAQDLGVPECFQEESLILLSVPRPAFILDDLFYVRAWNSYFSRYLGPLQPRLKSGVNLAKFAVEGQRLTDPDAEARRLAPLIRLFWMWTAHLGMTPQYSELMKNLTARQDVARLWEALAGEVDGEAEAPVIYPADNTVLGVSHTTYTRDILFPPLYRLVTWEPADEAAEQMLQEQIAAGVPEVGFADKLHWSVS